MNFKNLFILVALTALSSCKQKEVQMVQEPQAYDLLTTKVEDAQLVSNYSASIRGKQDIKIIPRVDGYLTSIKISEGDKVAKGDLLFIIDQVPFKSALAAAKAGVSLAEASVATAKLNLQGKEKLFKGNVVSEFDLQTAKNGLKTAEAQLAAAKAQEVAAKNNLSYTEIKSPSNGVVGKLPYRQGDYVSPATASGLTVVSDNSEMYVYFSMTEKQILDLTNEYPSIDSAIVAMHDVDLKLSNQTIYPQKGRIETISGIIEESTGAASVRAAFKNYDGKLLSGGAGTILLPYIKNDVIIIPQESTFEIQNKTYVYKVVDGKAHAVIIEVDKINDGREYIVTNGLAENETIIARGAGLVREGTLVKSK